jgi:hypothetical protein
MRWRHRRDRAWRFADQNPGEKRKGDGKVCEGSPEPKAVPWFWAYADGRRWRFSRPGGE